MEDLVQKTRATARDGKKRRRLAWGLGAILLLVVAGYFVRQFNLLYRRDIQGIAPPGRAERLDTTRGRETTITRLYELEEKNRHRDSLTRLEENKALDYIVMDWENLYDVRKKESRRVQDEAAISDSTSASLLQTLPADSLRQEGYMRRNHLPRSNARQTRLSGRGFTPSGELRYPDDGYAKPAATSAPRHRTGEVKPHADEKRETDPFNTGRAAGLQATGDTQTGAGGKDWGRKAVLPPGHFSGEAGFGHTASPAGKTIVPAVVHGDYKVQNGSKVTFRTLEGVTQDGMLLPVNTLITGLAQLSNGRITFTGFRARLDGSSIALPFSCYDSDMMAGISYGDQGSIETEVRRSATGALADAAGALSNAIPHSALARASGNIARGTLRGAGRKRESFVYLSDGYSVFLELQPPE